MINLNIKQKEAILAMADEKKDQVLDAVNVMEEKAMETADNLEKSRFGDIIPLEIVSLPLYEITKYLMLFIIFDSIPIYLISCEKDKNKAVDFIISMRNYLFIIVTVLSTLINLVTFYGKMITLYKFVVPMAIAKTIVAVIVVLWSSCYSLTSIGLALIYSLRIAALDSLFLYYLVILLKRVESDEYDNNGEKLKTKKEEEHEEKV